MSNAVSSAESGDSAKTPLNQSLAKTGGQLLRYGMNCGAVLLVKLALIVVLTRWLSPAIAYLLIHVVTFVLSYLIHARHTFDVEYSWHGVRKYFMAVALFKLFDYLVFNALLIAFTIAASTSVLLASCLEALLKFFIVRRALESRRTRVSSPESAEVRAVC